MSLGSCVIQNDTLGLADQIVEMRVQGISWKQIGEDLNIGSPSAARAKFTKLTGITDYKVKGPAVKALFQTGGTNAVTTATAKTTLKAVKNADDANIPLPTQYSGFKGHYELGDNDDFLADIYTPEIWDDPNFKLDTFHVDELYAGQSFKMDQDWIEKLIKDGIPDIEPDMDGPPIVALVNGKKVLIDGHHRAAAAAARGEKLQAYYYKKPLDKSYGGIKPKDHPKPKPIVAEAQSSIDVPVPKLPKAPKAKKLKDLTDDAKLVLEMNKSGKGYLAIKEATGKSYQEIDNLVWNDVLKSKKNKLWDAYKTKPTSQTGFDQVQTYTQSFFSKGYTSADIEKLTGIPADIADKVKAGTFQLPAPGTNPYSGGADLFGGSIPKAPKPVSSPGYSPPVPVSQGKNYRSAAEMDKWIDSLGKDLNATQKDAFKKYTGSYYGRINGKLRGVNQYGMYDGDVNTDVLIKGLDGAMKPLPFDTTLVRQTDAYKAFGATGKDLLKMEGQVWSDPGFLSTTIVPGGVWSGNVKIIIEAPKGTKGRWAKGLGPHHRREQEVVLARGMNMLITKVEDGGYSGMIVHMKVVG